MAGPYPETSEGLTDFQTYQAEFGFIENSNYDRVLPLPQTPLYNSNPGSSFNDMPGSFHSPGQSSQFDPSSSLHGLQDPAQIGGGGDDFYNWIQPRVTSSSAMEQAPIIGNMNTFRSNQLASAGQNQSSWEFDKPSRDSPSHPAPHTFDTSLWSHNPLSNLGIVPTGSSGILDFPAFQRLQERHTNQARVTETQGGSTSHTENPLGAPDDEMHRGEFLPRMSGPDPVQHLSDLAQMRHSGNLLRSKQEEDPEPEPKDVSSMLIDFESKLVASFRKPSPPPVLSIMSPQLERGMVHQAPHSGSWESDTPISDTKMVSSSNSRRGQQYRESASPGAPRPCGVLGQRGSELPKEYSNQQERGIRLVNLLIGCADAVAHKHESLAKSLLNELSHMVNPYGDSMQRVASYFTYGLVAHVARTGSGSNLYRALRIKQPTAADTLDAFQVFSKICPFMRFGELAATKAILEAFQGEQDVHWVDLGMAQGSLWLPYQLLQGLAARSGGPPKMIQLTGVQMKINPARSQEALINDDQTGRQIKEFADSLNLNFSFQPVSVERLEHLQPWMLTTRIGQAIAIHCSAKLHTLLYDDGKSLNHVLGIVHNLRPKVFCNLEQEASHNGPIFLARFLEALHFYSAMFDSLEATLARLSPDRAKVEQLWLGQEIINIIACEDQDRVERHERLQQWRFRMANAGFRHLPLSEAAVAHVKRMRSISYGTGFTLLEDGGSLILTWQDRPLFSCSIWTS